jgi:hypothetical protein
MEELQNLIYQLKTIKIQHIKPIKISNQLKKILECPIIKELKHETIFNNKKLYLNDCILEDLKTSKIKCSKCIRLSQYKNIDDNTFLCWNHCIL